MRLSGPLLFTAILVSPSIAGAADKSAPFPSEVRLSDAEKEKVLEEAAASRRESPIDQANSIDERPAPQVHGEVGFTIGTGGYRSVFGTAIVPFKEEGEAIISLDSTDLGSRGRYLDPWWR